MRRIASAALATLGLIAALVGAGLMTIWAPGSLVSASASAPEAAFIKTEPGVIDLVSSDVTITVAAAEKDADVTLVFGLADDVDAWTAGLPVATVTGLKNWDSLAVTESDSPKDGASPSASSSASASASGSASASASKSASPSASASTSPSASASGSASASASTSASPSASASGSASASASPSASSSASASASASASPSGANGTTAVDPNIATLVNSDMWIQTEQEKGKISVTYRVADKGAISLIAASSDGKAPKLTLEWDHPVKNPYAMPLIVGGLLALVVGLLIVIFDLQARRRERQRKDARDRRIDRRATRAAADTTVLSKIAVPEDGELSANAVAGGTDAVVETSDAPDTPEVAKDADDKKKVSGKETEGNADDEENTHA